MDYALDLKRFFYIFRFMIKRTVEEQILRTISFLESGRVFSSTDFADIANQNTIRTALRRLTLAKKIDALGAFFILQANHYQKIPNRLSAQI